MHAILFVRPSLDIWGRRFFSGEASLDRPHKLSAYSRLKAYMRLARSGYVAGSLAAIVQASDLLG